MDDTSQWTMPQEARESLRHYLSAAILFPGTDRDSSVRARTLAAFDRWFALGDAVRPAATSAQPGQPGQPAQPAVSDFDFRESVGLMLAAVGYTEDYARQWPKEKVSITFKRWFDEQIKNANVTQPEQPHDKTIDSILEGIDSDECSSHKGWWETSTGATFGASKLAEIKAYFAAVIPQPVQPARCVYCDDTGDVHDATGEWRGICTCAESKPAQPVPTWLTSVAAELGVTNLTEAEARQAGYTPLPVQPPGTTPQPAEGEPWNLLKT